MKKRKEKKISTAIKESLNPDQQAQMDKQISDFLEEGGKAGPSLSSEALECNKPDLLALIALGTNAYEAYSGSPVAYAKALAQLDVDFEKRTFVKQDILDKEGFDISANGFVESSKIQADSVTELAKAGDVHCEQIEKINNDYAVVCNLGNDNIATVDAIYKGVYDSLDRYENEFKDAETRVQVKTKELNARMFTEITPYVEGHKRSFEACKERFDRDKEALINTLQDELNPLKN